MNLQEKRFQFTVGNDVLSALSLLPPREEEHHIFSLHGAGSSSKERALYLLNELAARSGLGAFTFDFSGHGESSGRIRELSLKLREKQALEAIHMFGDEPLHIMGSSMGGDTVLRMLRHTCPRSLILFAPALYSDTAFDVPFADDFRSIITAPESWKNASSTLNLLEKYAGQLLIFIGEDDDVVPPGVIDLLDAHSGSTSRKEIVRIPGCGHSIHSHISKDSDVKEGVVSKVLEFIAE